MSVDVAVLVIAPGLWLFAYASFQRFETKRWDVRVVLAAMAVAATTVVVAALIDLVTNANGTALNVIGGVAMLLLVSPFVVFPLARVVKSLIRRRRI